MRRLTLIGNLTKDAEAKNVGGSNAIFFTVAVNDKYTDKNGVKVDKPFYYDCTIWKDDTKITKYFTKGTKIYIEGKDELNTWVDKEGKSKASIRCRVNHFEFLSSGNNAQSSGQENNSSSSMQSNENFTNEGKGDKDDLPF